MLHNLETMVSAIHDTSYISNVYKIHSPIFRSKHTYKQTNLTQNQLNFNR